MTQQKGHIGWIDLKGDGTQQEIAVLKVDPENEDIYFIAINDLDDIDRRRLIKVLKTPNALNYPLWELMANNTLSNGQNALDFFHQLVKIRTHSGTIMSVNSGRIGSKPAHLQNLTQKPAAESRGRGRPPGSTKTAE